MHEIHKLKTDFHFIMSFHLSRCHEKWSMLLLSVVKINLKHAVSISNSINPAPRVTRLHIHQNTRHMEVDKTQSSIPLWISSFQALSGSTGRSIIECTPSALTSTKYNGRNPTSLLFRASKFLVVACHA
jgi:hypothetical protein